MLFNQILLKGFLKAFQKVFNRQTLKKVFVAQIIFQRLYRSLLMWTEKKTRTMAYRKFSVESIPWSLSDEPFNFYKQQNSRSFKRVSVNSKSGSLLQAGGLLKCTLQTVDVSLRFWELFKGRRTQKKKAFRLTFFKVISKLLQKIFHKQFNRIWMDVILNVFYG